jgi:putative hydrolase of HD superfamily
VAGLRDLHGSLGSALRALYSLARTGWMLRGVPPSAAETVAQHSFLSAVLALELAWEASRRGLRVDPLHAAAVALLHDVAEAWVGDIPKPAGLDEAKEAAEDAAVEAAPLSPLAKGLHREYQERSTPEARLARAAELLATHLAAVWYRSLGYPVDDILANTLSAARGEAEAAGASEAFEALLERLGLARP